MAIENVLLGIDVVTIVLILVSFIFMIKAREYEKSAFEKSINVFLFGLILLLVIRVIDLIDLLDGIYHTSFVNIGFDLGVYMGSLINISGIVLMPLFGICVLVAVLFAKEGFERLDEKQ
jgi:hypothetical protein